MRKRDTLKKERGETEKKIFANHIFSIAFGSKIRNQPFYHGFGGTRKGVESEVSVLLRGFGFVKIRRINKGEKIHFGKEVEK